MQVLGQAFRLLFGGDFPGQEQPELRFATVPQRLTVAEWAKPTSYPCNDGRPCDGRYAEADLFYAEACVLMRICANGDEVFRLARGRPWRCALSGEGYRDLVRDLRRTTLNIDTHVDDYYSRRRRR